ncbi:MAG: glycosyltransferase family 8 protein [Clostridia bacterium]|nr:glycosyltransferase family 8 protein [Clostridia bacterium]
MNILFCGDKNIADGVIIATLSLMKNAPEPLNIYILTASIKARGKEIYALRSDFADFLRELVVSRNPQNTVSFYDISGLFASMPPTANMDTRFTPCCMLRLYADLLPELPERIMYLDNDVICRRDPSHFYHQDMEGVELAGTLDYYGSWFFRNDFLRRDYINSGVLLLNLSEIRKTGLFKKCRERCRTVEMFMPDQSALNKLAMTKRICDRRFNEQRILRDDTVFQHFTTSFRFFPWFHTVSVKPWNINGMHETLGLYEYDDILTEYLALKETYCKENI